MLGPLVTPRFVCLPTTCVTGTPKRRSAFVEQVLAEPAGDARRQGGENDLVDGLRAHGVVDRLQRIGIADLARNSLRGDGGCRTNHRCPSSG